MKNATRILSFLMALLMFVMALPVTVFAVKQETYIKEIRISTASTADAAKNWLTDNGYTVVNTDLNQKTGKDCVYIGYKTTTNPDEAITDIALMQMDGGYSFSEYKALLEAKMQEINNMLDALSVCLAEARANLAAGKKTAQGALEILNHFKEDDSGELLGDFLLGGEPSRSDLVKIFLQGNGNAIAIVYNMLAFACTDTGEDTSWLAKLENIDIYADYDPLVYNDAADAIFDSFVNIHDMVVTYENEYNGIADEIASNPEYDDYTDEELEDLLPDSYAEYAVIYETLANYQYDGKPLLDFFMRDPDELDTEELFPIVSALSLGQREIVKFTSLGLLISYAQMGESRVQTVIDTLKDACSFFSCVDGTISVYYGVDRSLFADGGVALTNAALRKSASTGDNTWFSSDHIDPNLSAALHVVASSFASIAIGAGIGAKFALSASQATYDAVFRTTCAKTTQVLKNLAAEREQTILNLIPEIRATNPTMTWEVARAQAVADIDATFEQFMLQVINGEYAGTMVQEAVEKLAKLSVTLNAVVSVASGLSMIFDGINMCIRVYNDYHPEYTEIPRIIVDEVVTDTDSYYVNYYAVKDQTDKSGDLNAWSAQRWNALYTTTDKKAGDPIIASSLIVKLKDSEFPSEDHGAVHYFGETAAANVNRYQFKKTAPATYIFYERDHSLSISMTASTFSNGQIVMFTGCGLLGGVAIGSLGVIAAGKMKKKKNEKEQSDI